MKEPPFRAAKTSISDMRFSAGSKVRVVELVLLASDGDAADVGDPHRKRIVPRICTDVREFQF